MVLESHFGERPVFLEPWDAAVMADELYQSKGIAGKAGLTGSHAKGNPYPTSDWDIYYRLQSESDTSLADSLRLPFQRLLQQSAPPNVEIDLQVYPPGHDFEAPNP